MARAVEHYNLDAILAVGYRVRSERGTQFRRWATFIRFNDRNVLDGKGVVSKSVADARAEAEYEEFAARRRELLEAEGERLGTRALEQSASRMGKKGEG